MPLQAPNPPETQPVINQVQLNNILGGADFSVHVDLKHYLTINAYQARIPSGTTIHLPHARNGQSPRVSLSGVAFGDKVHLTGSASSVKLPSLDRVDGVLDLRGLENIQYLYQQKEHLHPLMRAGACLLSSEQLNTLETVPGSKTVIKDYKVKRAEMINEERRLEAAVTPVMGRKRKVFEKENTDPTQRKITAGFFKQSNDDDAVKRPCLTQLGQVGSNGR